MSAGRSSDDTCVRAQGINPTLVAYLDIHVRRTHILQDSLQQIVSRPQVGVGVGVGVGWAWAERTCV